MIAQSLRLSAAVTLASLEKLERLGSVRFVDHALDEHEDAFTRPTRPHFAIGARDERRAAG